MRQCLVSFLLSCYVMRTMSLKCLQTKTRSQRYTRTYPLGNLAIIKNDGFTLRFSVKGVSDALVMLSPKQFSPVNAGRSAKMSGRCFIKKIAGLLGLTNDKCRRCRRRQGNRRHRCVRRRCPPFLSPTNHRSEIIVISNPSPTKKMPDVVITVIGAVNNTSTYVSRYEKNIQVAIDKFDTNGVLSSSELRQFTLIVTGTTLKLYSEGGYNPLAVYEHDTLVDMQYISFGTTMEGTVEWSMNCEDSASSPAQEDIAVIGLIDTVIPSESLSLGYNDVTAS